LPAEAYVGRLVREVFVERGRVDDANLHYADSYISRTNARAPVDRMLHLYRRLLEGELIPFDPNGPEQLHLRLSGAVAVEQGPDGGRRLRPRNRIFQEVLDLAWVREKEAELHLSGPLIRWLAAAPEKRADLVLRGTALEEAEQWAASRSDLREQERRFLEASQ